MASRCILDPYIRYHWLEGPVSVPISSACSQDLSAAAQVGKTLERRFARQTGLWVAAVDLARCGEAVRWEVSRGGEIFPHLYGTLMIADVLTLAPVEHGTANSLID